MNNYLTGLSAQLGVSFWLLVIILLWSLTWKLLALWKSAQKRHVLWFIILALVNTVGILPILYIYIFSDLKLENKKSKNNQRINSVRKKNKSKKPRTKK